MTEEFRPLPSGLRERREVVIERLTRHYASDHIETEEFERRLDLVYQAKTLQEIEAVQSDLPALEPATRTGVRTMTAGEEVRPWQVVVALLGGTERKGNWKPAREIYAIATMGGLVIDFREAQFAPGLTELNVLALMGGVEIIVPAGLRVECEGFGFMGGFEGLSQEGVASGGDRPTLRIRGIALMGGVEVTERLTDETARDKQRRLRDEKKKRKELRRG